MAVVPGRDGRSSLQLDPHAAARLADDWQELARLELEAAADDASRRRRSRGLWLAGIALLGLVLGLQAAYVQRDTLAADPRWRPAVEALCTVARCELPLPRDRDSLRLVRGQVSDHPERDGALVVTASLVNEADFRQPFPLLQLSLLNDNQDVAGERWFHPSDYLGDAEYADRWQEGMPPDIPVRVRLVLEDPGSGARQYLFQLR
ncbi:DUF3426 domain-containing protein [Aquisalimonas asiatica]|uniref:DUF3426 domain-containing protein n=1 Tax=Aquisalimonas asiatica TaxID=406100 RepID=UPI0014957CD4|nr:DUF3426 domain-containing protein [Aquisalimonas asiatica]